MPEVRLIDANALKRLIKSGDDLIFDTATEQELLHMIDYQPTVDTEVRHGRWIPVEYDSYADGAPVWDKYECSECGHEHVGEEDTLTDYCPKCGVKMYGGADDA